MKRYVHAIQQGNLIDFLLAEVVESCAVLQLLLDVFVLEVDDCVAVQHFLANARTEDCFADAVGIRFNCLVAAVLLRNELPRFCASELLQSLIFLGVVVVQQVLYHLGCHHPHRQIAQVIEVGHLH